MTNPRPKFAALWARRDFLKTSAVTSLGLALSRWPAFAHAPNRPDFEKLVPQDKRLSPEWVKSLFERGTPRVLRGEELKFVGMPVGGIGAGQLYLGGDGRLWHWDIFNEFIFTGAEHYAKPMLPAAPLTQKFSLKLGGQTVPLDQTGFADVSFRGEYPMATVNYAAPAIPLAVTLEAYSPFIPLNTDDSSLPATVFEFTVRNTSSAPVEAMLVGELENGVCLHHREQVGTLVNEIVKTGQTTLLLCSAKENTANTASPRPDIVFEDWDRPDYNDWRVEGQAFGAGPVKKTELPPYQGEVGGDTSRVVNSHATAPGNSIEAKDDATGRLISREFTVERDFISFWIGGGKANGNSLLGISLMVGGQIVLSASGHDKNEMTRQYFDVRPYAGKTAQIVIIDDAKGSWGNVGVGKITFTDRPEKSQRLEKLSDFGSLALGLFGNADETSGDQEAPFSTKLIGSLGKKFTLAANESVRVTFILTWHFPNLSIHKSFTDCGRYYATKFASARAVVEYVAANFIRLSGQTRLWRDTWYDSTLPYWFLDRTFLNTSILATSTCYRLGNGRFYGWEGVGDCPGTCGHVYLYAQAIARLFPDLERDLRERVDFGLAQKADGAIHFRGEFNGIPAMDAQSGYILRSLREHQMSADDQFLRRLWPRIKLAMEWLIKKDGNGDGLIESNQHNTLDTDWYGKVAWLSGLYLAALSASAQMANEVGDTEFAQQCRAILSVGQANFTAQLFDGEYYSNLIDPHHLDAINSGTGCEIDQVFGQSWAFQIGLPRVLPSQQTVSALKSLWRYNFTPDVGPWRAVNQPGRWYAMPGEAGLLMCTFPRDDWDFQKASGKGRPNWAAGYFNECMNGFEHQVAGHMLWEGMLLEGLAIERTVHDRYDATRRNPWNEIECGDHYARSMASYGVFLAAAGFEYHGPRQHIGFAPRLTPEQFKCAFTSSQGWGSYSQRLNAGGFAAEISLLHGSLSVRTVALASVGTNTVTVEHAGQFIVAQISREGNRVLITLAQPVTLMAGDSLKITLT